MLPWDAVVIGLGGVGSFALSALSKKSSRVLGIERFVRGHNRGSSHGASRIYRLAYFEHANYVPWIRYSLQEFSQLQTSQSIELMQPCGTLILEEPNGPVVQSSAHSAQKHGIPVESLSTNELKERYPQFRYRSDTVGLLEPGGGFVRPELAICAALDDAESRGASIWENTTVCSLKEIDKDHVQVIIEKNGIRDAIITKSVVVAAGSWTAELIPSWSKVLRVTRQLQGWLNVAASHNPDLYQPSNMPTWYMTTPESPLPMYGIPADPKSEHPTWIKMGLHLRNDPVDPNCARPDLTDNEWNELQETGRHTLYDKMSWARTKSCLYTMTPDQHFMIGPPANLNNVYAVAGLSGHGFKMTPALGQMMADWALGQDTSHWKTDFVSPSRFGL